MRRVGLILIGLLLAAAGCRSFHTRPALPVQHSIVRDQLIIYSDFPMPAHHRLLEELAAQRMDVSEKLKLPVTDEPIHVYLFRSPKAFEEFIAKHHPDFPDRRAFFVESDTRLAVYAHWGDRVAEDLRHEVAHGYLHAAVARLPLWLDEGLAEYFEVPRGNRGLNRPHLVELGELLDEGRWQPSLARLETLASAGDMTQLDYAEAWAWVHFLLETDDTHRHVLYDYLDALRREGRSAPLSLSLRKLYPEPNRVLAQYIAALR